MIIYHCQKTNKKHPITYKFILIDKFQFTAAVTAAAAATAATTIVNKFQATYQMYIHP